MSIEKEIALNHINQAGSMRESSQTIVSDMVKQHERELAAWNWLQIAMVKEAPDKAEEEALWHLLCRARSQRW